MTPKLLIKSQTEQLDAEDEWLADYMAGRLSPERTKEFEQRLRTDRQFFRRTAPFLSVLYPVEPTQIELEVRARVAARTAAMIRAKAERIERRRRRAALLGGAATREFWVKAGAGFATAATVLVAALQLAEPTMAPTPLFVHVVRPAPIVAQIPAPRRPSRPIVAAAVPVTPIQERVPVFVDPALDSALAGIDSTTVRAYFAPSGATIPTEQGRIALSPWAFPYQMDSAAAAREKGLPRTDGGLVQRVAGVLARVFGKFTGKLPDKPPVPKPNLQCQSPTLTTPWNPMMRPSSSCSRTILPDA
jgi:hypothetical protein